jgi:hypothetical protein
MFTSFEACFVNASEAVPARADRGVAREENPADARRIAAPAVAGDSSQPRNAISRAEPGDLVKIAGVI